MKTKTKVLVTALCAVLLVVVSVVGTMAFLTSQDAVTNTFTYGQVAITLDELDVDNDSDTDDNVTVGDATRDQANAYKLIPGQTYTKDPTIHVDKDSEDCWLFVKVENGLADAEDSENTIAGQMAALGWTAVNGTTNIYAYKETVSASDNVVVFNKFTIAGDTDVSKYGEAKINVTAYAIQAAGFDSAVDAWNAANLA